MNHVFIPCSIVTNKPPRKAVAENLGILCQLFFFFFFLYTMSFETTATTKKEKKKELIEVDV